MRVDVYSQLSSISAFAKDLKRVHLKLVFNYIVTAKLRISLVDVSLCLLTAVLNFSVCNGPKTNSNSTQIILGFLSRQNLYNPLVSLAGGRV